MRASASVATRFMEPPVSDDEFPLSGFPEFVGSGAVEELTDSVVWEAAAALNRAARAQQPDRVRRIGVLTGLEYMSAADPEYIAFACPA
jgi:hypothetical protein